MAKLGDDDDFEGYIKESYPYIREKLHDFTALIERGYLTLAQCALLIPSQLPGNDNNETADTLFEHYFVLLMLDISKGLVDPRHPVTLLPFSEYLRMMKEGSFGEEGERMPIPTADWFVFFEDAKKWMRSKYPDINFEEFEKELAEIREEKKPVSKIKVEAVKGITKQEVIDAFGGIRFNAAQWDRALTNVPDWLESSVVMRGRRGNNKQSTLWNPVSIAVALSQNGIPIIKLDPVFMRLSDWADEWRAKSDYFR